MSRGFDFTVVTVVWIVAVVIHRMGIELFQPGSPLYEIAANGNSNVNGAQLADLWFQILSIWVPLMAAGGILAWAMIREYRRQTITAARPAP
jgi:sterol desaturase/sphingolipid hydroxylase (fatty acid hydroxylase superfamily)